MTVMATAIAAPTYGTSIPNLNTSAILFFITLSSRVQLSLVYYIYTLIKYAYTGSLYTKGSRLENHTIFKAALSPRSAINDLDN